LRPRRGEGGRGRESRDAGQGTGNGDARKSRALPLFADWRLGHCRSPQLSWLADHRPLGLNGDWPFSAGKVEIAFMVDAPNADSIEF
jgi:hypothetical protein